MTPLTFRGVDLVLRGLALHLVYLHMYRTHIHTHKRTNNTTFKFLVHHRFIINAANYTCGCYHLFYTIISCNATSSLRLNLSFSFIWKWKDTYQKGKYFINIKCYILLPKNSFSLLFYL